MAESDAPSAKSKKIVESLRETFAPLTKRLTVDVDPATIYQISAAPPSEAPAHSPEDR